MKRKNCKRLIPGMAVVALAAACWTVKAATYPDAGTAVAPSGEGTTVKGKNLPAALPRLVGTVESIDRTANRIRIKDTTGAIAEYNMNGHTNFWKDQRKAQASDINPGDTATIDYSPTNMMIMNFAISAKQ